MQDMPLDSPMCCSRLREAGTPESQAQVQAAALWNVLRSDVSAIRAEMATKSDLAAARIELQASIADVRTEIANVRTELKQDIADVRQGLADVKDSLIRWMIGGTIGLAGTIACIMALMLSARP